LAEDDDAASTSSTPAPSPSRKASAYRFARLGDRFIAFALDIALLFGLFAIVDAWAFMRWGIFDGNELQLTTASLLIAVILNAAILFLYGWLFEAACGATLGKVLVGIRIVRTAQCGALSACAVRNLLGFYLVGTAVAACSEVRQRIGDICAHTAVIEEKFGIAARLAAVVLWIATLVGAGYTVPRICANNQAVHTKYLSRVIVRIGRNGNTAYFRIGGVTLDLKS
jgi:uncharacterized RDD family membrane protein YckC